MDILPKRWDKEAPASALGGFAVIRRQMYNSISYYDLSWLVGMGFKFGITDEVLWGTDKNGEEWQVLADQGLFLRFGKYNKETKLIDGNHEKMSREEFEERFV